MRPLDKKKKKKITYAFQNYYVPAETPGATA